MFIQAKMGYLVCLTLLAYQDGSDKALTKKQWQEMLAQLDNINIEVLTNIYGEADEAKYLDWILDEKANDMAKISTHFPTFNFELEGKGEDDNDYWKESWKAGQRIKLKREYDVNRYIAKTLKREHPEIYKNLIQRWYIPEPTDAKTIIIGGVDITKN